jgi:hypothetical protein
MLNDEQMAVEGTETQASIPQVGVTIAPQDSDSDEPRRKISQAVTVRYYDVARHWTKRIEAHLQDDMLNKILVHDFNDYTQGRWSEVFYPGTYPENIESCD